tara:strand:- start:1016 stop:3199 length:2184 start_codon:yes stop_codon:yes gene_type:complete
MPRDAQSQIDGDTQFMGISPRLDAGSLPAGMASEARNMRFRNGVAATRKGVYKPSWINNLTPEIDNRVRPFGEVHGVGVFRNPDSNLEFVVIAADGKAYYTRQGNNPIELDLPTGVVLVGEVNFTQAFNKLIMFRGEDFAPLVMTSEDTGFEDMIEQWDSTSAYAVSDEVAFGPLVSVSGIAFSSGTATVTTGAAHGFITGADVTIAGANESEFNGRFSITKTSDTTFTFTTTSSNSAATGTITATNNKEYYSCSTITSAGESPSTASSKWTQLSTIMPNASHGVSVANRIIVPTKYDASSTAYGNKRDFIAVSDALDHAHTFFNQLFRINFGSNSEVVDLLVFDENRVLIMKTLDVHMMTGFIVTDANGTLTNSASVQPVIQNYGVPNRGASVVVGSNVFFYASRRGIVSMAQTEQSKVRGVDLPLSEPIQPLIDRIDARNESKIRLAYWDNKLWVACPIDGGNNGENNALLVYDMLNSAWVSHDDGTAIKPKEFFVAEYNNAQRLFYIGTDGFINLVEENYEGDDVADLSKLDGVTTEQISSYLLTRGYGQPSVDHKNYRTATVNIKTWNPQYTIKARPDGVEEGQTLCTDRTKSRLNYYRPFDAAPFTPTNANLDHATPYREDYSVALVAANEFSITSEADEELTTESGDLIYQEAYDATEADRLNLGSGVQLDRMQETMEPFALTPRMGRYTQLEITNTQGRIELTQANLTSNQGDRTITVKS